MSAALDSLDEFFKAWRPGMSSAELRETMRAANLREAADTLGRGPACHWTEDADGDYATDCGWASAVSALNGSRWCGPADGGMRWCCFCGKPLRQVLFADTELVTLPAPLVQGVDAC